MQYTVYKCHRPIPCMQESVSMHKSPTPKEIWNCFIDVQFVSFNLHLNIILIKLSSCELSNKINKRIKFN